MKPYPCRGVARHYSRLWLPECARWPLIILHVYMPHCDNLWGASDERWPAIPGEELSTLSMMAWRRVSFLLSGQWFFSYFVILKIGQVNHSQLFSTTLLIFLYKILQNFQKQTKHGNMWAHKPVSRVVNGRQLVPLEAQCTLVYIYCYAYGHIKLFFEKRKNSRIV